MPTQVSTDAELRDSGATDALLRRARRLAETRGQRPNSAHVLLAILERDGAARDLLRERRVSPDGVARVAESQQDAGIELDQFASRARELQKSQRTGRDSGVHLLMAIVNARASAGRAALVREGVDLPRLRAACMNAGLGLVKKRPLDRPKSLSQSKAMSVPLTTRAIQPNGRIQEPARAPSPVVPQRPRPPKRSRATRAGRFGLDAKRHKLLARAGVNLTELAEANELALVVGRMAEIERVLDVLCKQRGNNPCLVGPAGVGKTAIVHGLVQRIANDERLSESDDRIVIEVSVSRLLQGALRGNLANRIAELCAEVASGKGRIVLFFDDLHQLLDAGDDLVSELERVLTLGRLPCIGATDPVRFARLLDRHPGLGRCFARVDVAEPDMDESSEILELASRVLSERHGVGYDAEAIACSIAWSQRYLAGKALPDKAISILDLAGARCRRRGDTEVHGEQVARVVSDLAAVPLERLLESDATRFLNLEQAMAERVVGHERQLHSICRILRRNAAGLSGSRPIGTFLLLGPTGVGKTETAKALSEVLFGSERAMSRFDLSEYSEPHSVARLIGAPPGYIGFEAGGQLTEAVRERPYQVLLLDEVEKAHPEVLATFLPLFDEGRLTDGQGRTVDFTHTAILLTSNVGAREATASADGRLGFGNRAPNPTSTEERVKAAAKKAFSPEFYNRIDETLVFAALSRTDTEAIARRLLQQLVDRVYERREISLSIDGNVVALLLRQGGFDPEMGARPMRRAIARWVEAPLAEALLRGEFPAGSRVRVCVSASGELSLQPEHVAAE
jgi:ATP-dependent Clp protease ATP-binding subunit ClpC